jgi:transposase
MTRAGYLTDLSDAEWQFIEPYLPNARNDGRPRKHPLREILDSIFYLTRGGCAWRLLPKDLPPWKTGGRPRRGAGGVAFFVPAVADGVAGVGRNGRGGRARVRDDGGRVLPGESLFGVAAWQN